MGYGNIICFIGKKLQISEDWKLERELCRVVVNLCNILLKYYATLAKNTTMKDEAE